LAFTEKFTFEFLALALALHVSGLGLGLVALALTPLALLTSLQLHNYLAANKF